MAAGQRSALTGRQLRAVMGERSIRRAVRDGRLIKLWQGAYAVPVHRIAQDLGRSRARNEDPVHESSAPTLTRLGAAQLTLGRPVTACLHTAAELYGFATEADPHTHVLGAAGSSHDQLVVHRTPSIRPNLRTDGFGVVDPAQTAVRLAALAPNAPRALACLDAALRSGQTTKAGMAAGAQELHVTRVDLVRALVVSADARSESPPESWLRWVCHNAGFPPPEPQFWVKCPSGAWFRLDLAWPELKLGLEYDGVEFHTGAALTADRARRNALTAEGWTILSVTAQCCGTADHSWSSRSPPNCVGAAHAEATPGGPLDHQTTRPADPLRSDPDGS